MADVSVREHGTVTQFIPLTPDGKRWIFDNLVETKPDNLMWFGQTVCLPWRDAMNVLPQMQYAGITVELS